MRFSSVPAIRKGWCACWVPAPAGKALDPNSAAARAYGLKPDLFARERGALRRWPAAVLAAPNADIVLA